MKIKMEASCVVKSGKKSYSNLQIMMRMMMMMMMDDDDDDDDDDESWGHHLSSSSGSLMDESGQTKGSAERTSPL